MGFVLNFITITEGTYPFIERDFVQKGYSVQRRRQTNISQSRGIQLVGIESKCGEVMQPSWMIKVIEGWEESKKCCREEDGNVKFVVGEGVGEENGGLALGSRFSRWALGSIGRSRTQRNSCFLKALMSRSSFRDGNKYSGIWFMLQTKRRTRW